MEKSEFKILVADDDRIVQDVILNFLTQEGFPLVEARDGLDALERIRLEDIKLVLTDLRMPGADGMEVLRTALQINPRIAVVLMTAYGTLDTALEAMKEGAYDYIVKPFVMQQLLLVVRNAYRMAALYRENENLTGQLKETMRNLDVLKGRSNDDFDEHPDSSYEHVEKLKEQNVIDAEEAEMLKERLSQKTLQGSLQKYSSLVKDLNTK